MLVVLWVPEQHVQRPSGIATAQCKLEPSWSEGCWGRGRNEVGKAFCARLRGLEVTDTLSGE